MPRKPSAVLDYKLRIRETLRRRIEQSAKKRGVSINAEMSSRLERSYDQDRQRTIDETAGDIAASWGRWGDALHRLNKQGDLARAVEALIAALPTEMREEGKIGAAVAKAKAVLAMIDAEAALAVRKAHTTGAE